MYFYVGIEGITVVESFLQYSRTEMRCTNPPTSHYIGAWRRNPELRPHSWSQWPPKPNGSGFWVFFYECNIQRPRQKKCCPNCIRLIGRICWNRRGPWPLGRPSLFDILQVLRWMEPIFATTIRLGENCRSAKLDFRTNLLIFRSHRIRP